MMLVTKFKQLMSEHQEKAKSITNSVISQHDLHFVKDYALMVLLKSLFSRLQVKMISPGGCSIKYITDFCNKLECLSLASLSSLV
jgi:hypothetical protein